MWQDAQNAYLENRILSAEPLELVGLMYQAATTAVREARQHLADGDIAARSRSISKACEILIELGSSLDHARGGEISQRLAALYDYLVGRLIEANLQQADAPLAEVLGLLATLAEAWDGVRAQTAPASPAANAWAQPMAQEPVENYSSHQWSL